MPNNSPKCAGKSKVIEERHLCNRLAELLFPAPIISINSFWMGKVGIWCGEWEEDISLEG